MLQSCFLDNGDFNNEEFNKLVQQHRGQIIGNIQNFFIIGGDKQDLYQWGLIGLYKAVLQFDETKGIPFYWIVEWNIKNTIKTAVTSARRKKHEVLSRSISLYQRCDDGQDDKECAEISQYLSQCYEDPSNVIIEKETIAHINFIIKSSLSTLEYKVMTLWTLGYRQPEIASQIGVGVKVVDNAMQRARKKLTNRFGSCEDALGATRKFKI